MQIDFDCARAVLIAVDECLSEKHYCGLSDVEERLADFDELTIYYASLALRDEGYIKGIFDHSDMHEMHICDYRYITLDGRNWLQSVKPENNWKKIKDFFFQNGATITFGAIQSVLALLSLDDR